MIDQMDILTVLTSSKSRSTILGLFFDSLPVTLHLREVERRTGISTGTLHRELDRLVSHGLLKSERDGNRVQYTANRDHPLFDTLRELVLKTVGLPAHIAQALAGLPIDAAFIFGSLPRNEMREDSDIDLLVIGDTSLKDIVSRLPPVVSRSGREVNPYVQNEEEFKRRVSAGEHFVRSVLENEKLFVIGDERVLERLGA